MKNKTEENRNVITVLNGKKDVLINDIRFKSRRNIQWNEIEEYIAVDFPDEYSHSQDTKTAKGANEKAKANAITVIGKLIEIADHKTESPDYGNKHGNKAKYGWYRYDTGLGIPVYDENDILQRYNRKIVSKARRQTALAKAARQ